MITCCHYPFINPPLPYAYNSLEPYIDEKTMQLHHDNHLQSYVNNLNSTLVNFPSLQNLSLQQLILSAVNLPFPLSLAVRNNAGGVLNHTFFFNQLSNNLRSFPEGKLAFAINRDFCSFDNFKRQFKEVALSVFGSGYAWLVINCAKKLQIITTQNQDNPISNGMSPLLNVDVWEHAYYLKHYNKRGDYLDDFFNVINWEVVEERFNFRFC